MRGVFLIYKKEFAELGKDKKTLFFTIFLPLLLYPLLFGILGKMGQTESRNIQQTPSRVHLVDPSGVLEPALKDDPKHFQIMPLSQGKAEQAIRDRKLDLAVEVSPDAADKLKQQATYVIKAASDPSEDASRMALTRLKDVLKAKDAAIVQDRLKSASLSLQLATPTKLETTDVGGMNRMLAKLIGVVVPFLMVIMMLTGAMQQGIYATTGERERGTLQTLLATSLPRTQIILGKLLYIFSVGLIAALTSLLSVSISLSRLFFMAESPKVAAQNTPALAGLSALTDPGTILLAFLLLVPLGLLFANVILYLGIQAKNVQEAGTSITPFMIAIMVLCYVSIAPGAEKMAILPYIPVVNVSLMLRKMITQQMPAIEYVVTLAMTLGLAGLITWLAVRRLNDDETIFKTS